MGCGHYCITLYSESDNLAEMQRQVLEKDIVEQFDEA